MHTWSDVAYGFFVGSGHDASPAELIAFLSLVGFVIWAVWRS